MTESTAKGKANLDEEDPDMDGWSDFDSDSKQEDQTVEDEDDSKDSNDNSLLHALSSDDTDEGEQRFGSIKEAESMSGSVDGDGSEDGTKSSISKKRQQKATKEQEIHFRLC